MTSGIIGIKFKDGLSDQQIQTIIETLFFKNRGSIESMNYFEFKNHESVLDILKGL